MTPILRIAQAQTVLNSHRLPGILARLQDGRLQIQRPTQDRLPGSMRDYATRVAHAFMTVGYGVSGMTEETIELRRLDR
jgi:hypothetical protein